MPSRSLCALPYRLSSQMTYERRVSAYPSRKVSPAKGERGVDSGLERRVPGNSQGSLDWRARWFATIKRIQTAGPAVDTGVLGHRPGHGQGIARARPGRPAATLKAGPAAGRRPGH